MATHLAKDTATQSAPKAPAASTTKQSPTVTLPGVTKLDGAAFSTLSNALKERYSSIVLIGTNKAEYVLVGDPGKVARLGHLGEFLRAAVFAAQGSDGSSTGGCVLHTAKNWDTVQKTVANIAKSTLVLTPVGRSGTMKIKATVAQFVNVSMAKAPIIECSLEEFGAARVKPRKSTEDTTPIALSL